MPNYKEMYLHMIRETEAAIQILIQAQKTCEELYLSETEPPITQLPASDVRPE